MSKTYQVGVVGFGLSAKVFQIPYIQSTPGFELRAIVQRSGSEAREKHPEATIYNSPAELLADERIDVVVVSTPPATHFELVAAALNAGKHGRFSIHGSAKTCADKTNLSLQWSSRSRSALPVKNATS